MLHQRLLLKQKNKTKNKNCRHRNRRPRWACNFLWRCRRLPLGRVCSARAPLELPKERRNKTTSSTLAPNRGSLGVLWTYSGSVVVLSWDLTHKNTQTSTQAHECRVSHTDPSSHDTNTRGSPRPRIKRTPLHKDINLIKTDLQISPKLLLLPFHFSSVGLSLTVQNVQSKSTRRPAVSPTMSYDWLNSVVKGITWSEKAARTARAKIMALPRVDQPQAPDTVDKLWQVYKVESCQQQRRFSSCKHLSLVSFCELFSVFRQLRSEFCHHWIELLVRFSLFALSFHWLWNFYSVTCIRPLQYQYFNSPIHIFLCISPSGGFTYCTGLTSRARAKLLRPIKWEYRSRPGN